MKRLFSFLCAAAAVIGIFVFLTGGAPFIPPGLESLIAQKPALHRVAVMLLSLAGFAALFVKKWKIAISPRKILLLLFVSSFVSWTAASALRFLSFEDGFDMAIFVQAVWNTLHGNFLYSSIKGGICLLGDHMSPLLALLALPYALAPHPLTLLVLQALSAAAAVFPLYRLSERHLKNPGAALALVFAYTVYLPLRNAVRFEFHPEVLAAPFLIWAFDAADRKKNIQASIFMLLVLLSKEGAALSVFAMACFIFIRLEGQKKLALAWAVLSAAWFVVSVRWLIPHFSGQDYFYLSGNFIAWKDEGIAALLKHAASPSSAAYLTKIFAPVAFLALLDPVSLIPALPALAQNLTARNPQVFSIFFQYTAFLTPAVFISTVYGLKRAKTWAPWLLAGFSILMAGVPEGYLISRSIKTAGDPFLAETRAFLKTVPADASVRTHEFLAPYLAHRKNLHIYENHHPKEGGSPAALASDFVIIGNKWLGDHAEADFKAVEEAGYRLTSNLTTLRVYQKVPGER